jgi:hypothetical protein
MFVTIQTQAALGIMIINASMSKNDINASCSKYSQYLLVVTDLGLHSYAKARSNLGNNSFLF